ncbi:MAG: hypothetical protein EXS14_08830 [Planctomycetes bacterium]|nr:hypothetical protein [Planctomycetota bacterium]
MKAAALALCAAFVFALLASPQLDAPGLEYDEVHQACGSFGWLGVQSPFFSQQHVGSVPLFTMHYSGALKTGLYGIWMRLSGAGFEVLSWRWLGLGIAALAVGLLPWLLRRRLAPWPLLLLTLWVLTDITLLLGARHDRGPVAIAFLLRVLLIGVLFGRPAGTALHRHACFLAGFLVGLATWEKLPNALLLLPALWCVLREAQSVRNAVALGIGGLIGALPVAVANVISLLRGEGLFSLHEVSGENPYTLQLFLQQLGDTVAIGSGSLARANMLGLRDTFAASAVMFEIFFAGILLLLLLWLARRHVAAGLRVAVGTALTMLLLLPLLPEIATEHHHLLLLPFLPLAAALALSAPTLQPRMRALLMVLCCCCIAARMPLFFETLSALRATPVATGRGFNPEFTRFATSVAQESAETRVLAAGWGIATQVHCLAQGRAGIVREVYWHEPDAAALNAAAGTARRIVMVAPVNLRGVNAPRRDALFALAQIQPGWRSVPLPAAWTEFSALRVEIYER